MTQYVSRTPLPAAIAADKEGGIKGGILADTASSITSFEKRFDDDNRKQCSKQAGPRNNQRSRDETVLAGVYATD